MVKIALVYVGTILVHYTCVHTYQYACTPSTLQGFVMSPLMASSPHCKGMRWAIYEMGQKIDLMWITIGVATVMYLNNLQRKKN